MRIQAATRRDGFSLVEVLAATAIFLFSLIAFGQLLQVCSDMAKSTQYTNRAHQLLESKLNAVAGGILPLQSSEGAFDDDEAQGWSYSITADADGSIPNLYTVTVKVSRKTAEGDTFERMVTQKIFDPAQKGTFDSSSGSSSSGSSTGGSSTP
ncbi:MAG: prepilin-type N-terminal cleavage/methylation domain-containing protein [Gemmataceae bacterium]